MYNDSEGGVVTHFLPLISCLFGKMISISTLINGFSSYTVFLFIFILKGICKMFTSMYLVACVFTAWLREAW